MIKKEHCAAAERELKRKRNAAEADEAGAIEIDTEMVDDDMD